MKVADVNKIKWYLGVTENGAPGAYTTSKDVDEATFEIDDKYNVVIRRGEWIKKSYLFGWTYVCSLCGENYGMPHGIYKYCPNCGARMEDNNANQRND